MSGSATAASMGAEPTSEVRRRSRGSMFTDRQIFHAVRNDQAVKVWTHNGPAFTGFVFGMDDYHWGLIQFDGTKILVHKTAVAVELTTHRLDDISEIDRKRIEPVVFGFREYVVKEIFKQQPPRTGS